MLGRDYVGIHDGLDRSTAFTSHEVNVTLELELGVRAMSWAYDVNRFEWEPEAYAAIPGLGWELADALHEAHMESG